MNQPQPRILVIQHVAVEPASNIATAITHAGGRCDVVRIFDGQPVPSSIAGHSGLVIMGGPMGVYEADVHPHLFGERRLIEDALAARVPVLGICLGSQLLASVLGATVRPGPRKEIGWLPVTLSPEAAVDPLFAGLPATFTALHWHGDIFDLPPRAVGLARSELTAHQAFAVEDFAWGILFHLEVTQAQLGDMTTAFAGELAQVHLSPHEVMAGWTTHGGPLEALARTVFGRWMQAVARRLE